VCVSVCVSAVCVSQRAPGGLPLRRLSILLLVAGAGVFACPSRARVVRAVLASFAAVPPPRLEAAQRASRHGGGEDTLGVCNFR